MSVTALQVYLRFAPEEKYKVGRIAIAGRDVLFQYDEEFIGSGLAISPYNLPLKRGVQAFNRTGGLELFGVFEDSMPDSWGRRLIDRHFQKTLNRPPTLLERLSFVGERAMGALTFYPPEESAAAAPDKDLTLAQLAQQAWDFEAEKIEDALPELRRVAGTSGGARPKVLLGLSDESKSILPGDNDLPAGYEHWIVKFNSRIDVKDAGALEYAYAEIAVAAGAEMPKHRLLSSGKERFFATKRFDRPSRERRLHMHSAAGLLHFDFRTPGTEYKELFRLTDALTLDYSQKKELFRRTCLNVLACNRDDHLKNFSFLMDAYGKWRLSPLYDFTFNPGRNGWHTLSVAGEGQNPGRTDLMKLSQEVGLIERDAREIIDAVRSAVASFDGLAKKLKLSASTARRVKMRLKALDM